MQAICLGDAGEEEQDARHPGPSAVEPGLPVLCERESEQSR